MKKQHSSYRTNPKVDFLCNNQLQTYSYSQQVFLFLHVFICKFEFWWTVVGSCILPGSLEDRFFSL